LLRYFSIDFINTSIAEVTVEKGKNGILRENDNRPNDGTSGKDGKTVSWADVVRGK